MKLHLPRALRGALLACFAVACTVPSWAAVIPSDSEVGRLQIYDGEPPKEPEITAEFQADETTAGVLSAINSQIDCNNYEGDYSWTIRIAGVITRPADTTKDIIILTNVNDEKKIGDTFDPSKDLRSGQFMLVLTQAGELVLYNSDKCSSEEEFEKSTMATYYTVGNLGDTDWTMMKFNFYISAQSMGEGAYQALVLDANSEEGSTTTPKSFLYLYDAGGNQLLTNVTPEGNDRDVLQYGYVNMGKEINKDDLNSEMYTRLPESSYISLYNKLEAPTVDGLDFPIATKQPLAVNWYLVKTATVEDLRSGTYSDYDSQASVGMLDTETLVFCGGALATKDNATITVDNNLNVQEATTNVILAPGKNATMVITNGEQALTPGLLAYNTDGTAIYKEGQTPVYKGQLIIDGGENSKVVLQNMTTTTTLKNTKINSGGLELAGDASSVYTIDLSESTLSIAETASLGVSGGSTLDLIAKTDGSSKLGNLTGNDGLIRLHNTLTTTKVNTDGLTILEGAALTVNETFNADTVTLEKGTTLSITGSTSSGAITVGENATLSFNAMASTGAIKVGKNATLTSTSFISNKGITTEEGATVTVNGSINAGSQNIILGKSSSMTSNTSTIRIGSLILMEGTDTEKTTATSKAVYSDKGDVIVNNNATLTTDSITLMNGNIVASGAASSIDVAGAVTSTGVQLQDGGTLTITPAGSLTTTGASTIDGGQIQYGDLLIEASSADTAAEFSGLSFKTDSLSAGMASNATITLDAPKSKAAGTTKTISLGEVDNTTITSSDNDVVVKDTSFTNNSSLTVENGALTMNNAAVDASSTIEVTGTGAEATLEGTGLFMEDGASFTVGDSTFTATNAKNGVSITGEVKDNVLKVDSVTANIRHLNDPNAFDADGLEFICSNTEGSIDDGDISYNLIYAPGMAGDMIVNADGHLSLVLRDDSAAIVEELRTTENATEAVDALWDGWNSGARDEMQEIFDHLRDTSLASLEQRQAVLAQLSSGSITMLADSQRRGVMNTIYALRNRVIQMGNPQNIEPETHLHAWIEADGSNNDIEQDGNLAGYEFQTWGGTVGAHADVGNFSFGAALSASYGELTSTALDRAEGNHDTVSLSAFVRHQKGAWTQMGILSIARNELDMTRTVNGALGDGTPTSYNAEGDASGHTITAYYEVGYSYAITEDFSQLIQPHVSIMLTSARMGNFSETGSIGNAGLCTETEDYFYGTVGVGARYQAVLGTNVEGRLCFAEARAKLVADFGDDTHEATVRYAGAPGTFRLSGAEVGKVGFQFGAGISVPVGVYTTLFADVDADIRSAATAISGSMGVRVEF